MTPPDRSQTSLTSSTSARIQVASLPLLRAVTEPPDARRAWERAIDDVLTAETDAGPGQGARARGIIEDAAREGLLADVVPSTVVHEMAANGARVLGVLALLSTTLVDEGLVRPHEQTLRSREERLATFQDDCPFDIAPVLIAHRPSSTLDALVERTVGSGAVLALEHDGVEHRWWQGRGDDADQFVDSLEGMTVMDGHHRVAAAQRRAMAQRAPQPIFAELVSQEALALRGFHVLVEIADADEARRVIEAWGNVIEVDDGAVALPSGNTVLVRLGGRWLMVVPQATTPAAQRTIGDPGGTDPSDTAFASLVGLWSRERLLGRVLDVEDPGDDERALALPGIAPLDRLARIADGLAPADPLWPIGYSGGPTARAALVVEAPQASAIVHAAGQGIVLPPKSTFVHPKPPPGALIHRREVLTRGG